MVTVTFSKGPTNTSAWIGLYASSSGDGAYLAYQYTGGADSGSLTFADSGSLTFTAPEATGVYDLRLFADGGYNKIATSSAFTVSYPCRHRLRRCRSDRRRSE